MDQPSTSTDLTRDQQALRERLTRLEEIVRLERQHDRERNYQAWAGLQGQVLEMKGDINALSLLHSRQPLSVGQWIKILVGILLPYIALLMTGSIEIAHRVASVGL